jgi:hypothetical protein
MAEKKPDLNAHERTHVQLMRSIARGLNDTPLLLKGGTALLLAYGLQRFSEDLDFDSPQRLNLESRIRRHIPAGVALTNIDVLKNTETVTRYRLNYDSADGPGRLKIEVSHRGPAANERDVRVVDGIRVAALPTIVDQKLLAAHDGVDTRSAARDLYDLHHLAAHFPAVFSPGLAARLQEFSASPSDLSSRYLADYEEDHLIHTLIELDELSLSLHYRAADIAHNVSVVEQRIQQIPSLRNSAGPSYTFWRVATEAIKKAGTHVSAREIDWHAVEQTVISEAIAQHGQPPTKAIEVIAALSPGSATAARQEELLSILNQEAPGLRAQYENRRDEPSADDSPSPPNFRP